MKFCGRCGAQLGVTCSACGFINPREFNYCGMCGKALSDQVPASGELADVAAIMTSARENGHAPEISRPTQLEGERRVVTVVVADVTGSTNLLEEVGNETWVEMMNRVLLALEAEIYRYNGVVDQFRGDGLVAFFGSDVSNEDDPERAIQAGLAMQQAIEKFNRELTRNENVGIRLRVGINTGEVIVARIGEANQHREDTAMGIAIAVAARLESAAEPGTVLVSESTYQQAEMQFTWQSLGEITVKGISQPLAVYRPIAMRVDANPDVQIDVFGYAVPLVGRDKELHELKQHVELLKMGQGSLVFVAGETGIGKQALISELRQYYLRQDALIADALGQEEPVGETLTWLFGRCRSYSLSWPYSIWIELVHRWMGGYTGQQQEDERIQLRDRCIDLWGDQYSHYYPYLVEMLRLSIEDEFQEKVRFLSAEALRIKIFETIQAWVVALAERSPLVVVLSELEYADPSSLLLIKSCAPLCEQHRILFLCLYRKDIDDQIRQQIISIMEELPGVSQEIELQPLSAQDIEQFITYFVGPNVIPEPTRALLARNSEGNPSYIVEILRSLIDKGLLVQDGGTGEWRLSREINAQDLQGNLNRLLQARIDRLDEDVQQVLQMAAVIGVIFWSNALQLAVGEQVLVKEPLNELVKAQLIERRGRNPELGTEYAFKTDVIYSVVYESLLTTQREASHLRVAKILEELIQTDGGIEHQALIAYHYRRAREPRKELFYVTWAAEKAREIYAVEEAFEHYTRALDLLDILEAETSDTEKLEALRSQRFEVLNGRLALTYLTGNVDQAMVDAHALLEIATQFGEQPIWMIDALLKQPPIILGDTWDLLQEGLRMADQALELSRKIGDKHREMFSLMAKARLLQMAGDPLGLTITNEALGLAQELEDATNQITLLLALADEYGMENPNLGKQYLDAALELRDRISDKRILLDLLTTLGSIYEREGDYYRLLVDYVARRLEICREIGDRLSEGFVLMYYAQVEGLYLGDTDAALERVMHALKLTAKVTGSLYPLLRIAQIQIRQGLYDQAEETLAKARPLSEHGVAHIGRVGWMLVSALLYNDRGNPGDYERVIDLASQVKRLVEEQRVSPQYRIAACCESVQAYLQLEPMSADEEQASGFLVRALEESSQALRNYQDYGFVQIIECSSEEVFYRHGQALAANRKQEEAEIYYRQAYDEMMRKYDKIPADSHFRKTYLENIPVHREILAVYRPEQA